MSNSRAFLYQILFVAFETALVGYSERSFAQAGHQCDRLFEERREIDTCHTLLQLRDSSPSDVELLELVSQQVYGLSHREALAAREKARKAQQEATAEIASQPKEDQCGRVFQFQYERDVCRWQGIFTSARRTDLELREAVSADIRRMESDPQFKAQVVATIQRMRTDEVQDRIYAKEAEQRRIAAERKATEERRRTAENAKERERIRMAEAARRDEILKIGKVGFLPSTWKLGGLGTTLIAAFWLQNNTPTTAKDFSIACETAGESGTRLSSVRGVVYSQLAAGERRAFELNMGIVHPQSAKVSCRLIEWK